MVCPASGSSPLAEQCHGVPGAVPAHRWNHPACAPPEPVPGGRASIRGRGSNAHATLRRRTGNRLTVMITVTGPAYLDVLMRVSHLAAEGEKVRGHVVRESPGGGAMNTSAWLAAEGADVRLVTPRADDSEGLMLREACDGVGLQVRWCWYRAVASAPSTPDTSRRRRIPRSSRRWATRPASLGHRGEMSTCERPLPPTQRCVPATRERSPTMPRPVTIGICTSGQRPRIRAVWVTTCWMPHTQDGV